MNARRVTYKDRIRAAYVLDQARESGRLNVLDYIALSEFTGTRRLTATEVRVGIDLVRRTTAAVEGLEATRREARRFTTGKL